MINTLKKLLVFIPIALSVGAMQVQAVTLTAAALPAFEQAAPKVALAKREMALTNRHANEWVNGVFADNILLNLAYLSGEVTKAEDINWDEIRKTKAQTFALQPGEVFAYHDQVLPQFEGKVTHTTNSRFNAQDGYRSSGLLYGDGVCHLATLFNWAATDAGLNVVAPVKHDFAPVPAIDRQYGTAIYYDPGNKGVSQQQNLYIQNTLNVPVTFIIYSDKEKVTISVVK